MTRKNAIFCSFLQVLTSIISSCIADLTDVHSLIETNEIPTFKPLVYDNGMLHLVLEDLAEDLVRELSMDTSLNVTLDVQRAIHSRIRGFYHHIVGHPALKNRNIAFTKTPLQTTQTQQTTGTKEDDDVGSGTDETLSRQRHGAMRKRNVGRYEEVCRSMYAWEFRTEGERYRDHRVVRLFEGQQFHVMSCVTAGAPCHALPIRYVSECRERYTWTLARVWSEEQQGYEWDHIAINTSCNCAVSQASLVG